MNDFFKMMWRRGLKVLLIIVLVWLVFFLINFLYPNAFNFTKNNDSIPGQNSIRNLSQKEEKIPLRFKIYNLFFKGKSTPPTETKNISNATEADPNLKNPSYIWGDSQGSNLASRDKSRLLAEDLYIFPDNQVANNFSIDGLPVKENGINILAPNSTITGNVSSEYLSNIYFDFFIYDIDGNFIYSIPAIGYKDGDVLKVTGTSQGFFNSKEYKGDGFMVIWTDNPEVEAIILMKVRVD